MMLDTATMPPAPAQSAQRSDRPRLMSLDRARRELGDIGKTRLYDMVREHGLRLLKVGGRTVIPAEDVDHLIDKIIASAKPPAIDRVKAMAVRSVEARRQSPPRKRRRRGSSVAA